MGQKVHPTGFRMGNTFTWASRWFSKPDTYQDKVLEDFRIRKMLNTKLSSAGLVRVDIERSLTAMKIVLMVSRPGVVIGKGGDNLKVVHEAIEKVIKLSTDKKKQVKLDIKVEEVKKPDLSAKLVAEKIVEQLLKRYPHRRAVKQALERVMQAGAKGVKIALSGRIGGAEIGRSEKYAEGTVPTQTLRANIDYFSMPAPTRSGYVGIKVWIYKGEVL